MDSSIWREKLPNMKRMTKYGNNNRIRDEYCTENVGRTAVMLVSEGLIYPYNIPGGVLSHKNIFQQ